MEILESESKKVQISLNKNCNSSGLSAFVHFDLLLLTLYADTKPMVNSSLDSQPYNKQFFVVYFFKCGT